MKNYSIDINSKEFSNVLANEINKGNSTLLNVIYKTAKKNPDLISEIAIKKLPKMFNGYGTIKELDWISFLLKNRTFDWLKLFLENHIVKKSIIESIKVEIDKSTNNIIESPKHALFNKEYGIDSLLKYNIDFTENLRRNINIDINKDILKYMGDIFLESIKDNDVIKTFLNSSIEKEYRLYKKNKLIKLPMYFEYLNLFEEKDRLEKLKNANIIDWTLKSSDNQSILYLILNYSTNLIDLILENLPEEAWHIKDNNTRTPLEHLLTRNLENEQNINRVTYILNKNFINLTAIDIKRLIKKTIDAYSNNEDENIQKELIKLFETLIQSPLIHEPIVKEALKELEKKEGVWGDIKDLKAVFLNHVLQKSLPENNIKVMKKKL